MARRNFPQRTGRPQTETLLLRQFARSQNADVIPPADGGNGADQALSVGMGGMMENIRGRTDLHKISGVHNAHPVGDLRLERHIMPDHDHGSLEAGPHIGQDLQYRLLRDHIQCAGGLVRHNQFGGQQRGHSDADPLLHASGKLMGIPLSHLRRQIDAVKGFRRTLAQFFLAFSPFVGLNGFKKVLADRNPRPQERCR